MTGEFQTHPAWTDPKSAKLSQAMQATQASQATQLAEPEKAVTYAVGNWTTAKAMTTSIIPLCVNCKFYRKNSVFEFCDRETEFDPVSGGTKIVKRFCEIERSTSKDPEIARVLENDKRWCGLRGKYFVFGPQPKPEPKKWWNFFS